MPSFFKRSNLAIKKVLVKRNVAVFGLLLLPLLFGMSLISIGTVGNKVILVSPNHVPVSIPQSATMPLKGSQPAAPTTSVPEATSEEVQQLLKETAIWPYIGAAMFLGAFLVSLVLTLLSSWKFTVHTIFKTAFPTSAALIGLANAMMPWFDAPFVLILLRLAIGVGVGILCALCSSYYMASYGTKTGAILASAHGLAVPLGVGVAVGAAELLGQQHEHWIFYLTAAIALISFICIVAAVTNDRQPNQETELNVVTAAGSESFKEPADSRLTPTDYHLVGMCVGMHVLQQLTGINPMLTYCSTIFDQADNYQGTAEVAARLFFSLAGLFGGLFFLGASMTPKFLQRFGGLVLLTGVACALSFVPIIHSPATTISQWAIGLYYMLFSMGIASLPWMLPSIILGHKPKAESLAIGYGVMANWCLSSVLAFVHPLILERIGGAIYIFYATVCVAAALFGYFVLKRYAKVTGASAAKRVGSLGLEEAGQSLVAGPRLTKAAAPLASGSWSKR